MKEKKKDIPPIRITKIVFDNMLGPNHTHSHRIKAGIPIMVIGVMVAKSAALIHVESAYIIIQLLGSLGHGLLDLIGYALHGLGLTPVAEYLIHKYKNEDIQKDEEEEEKEKNNKKNQEKEKEEVL